MLAGARFPGTTWAGETRGHPWVIFRRISGVSSSWVTVRRTMSPTVSMSMATRECFDLSAAAATSPQVMAQPLVGWTTFHLPYQLHRANLTVIRDMPPLGNRLPV